MARPAQPAFLVAGAAHWDLIARTDAPLPPGADVPGRVTRTPGGVALNIAMALAALDRPVTLLATLGTDPDGDALAACLAAARITPALHRHPGPTDAYLAIEGADGSLLAGVADCTALDHAGPALLDALPTPWPGPTILDGNLSLPVLAALSDACAGPLALVPASPRKAAALAPLLSRRPLSLYLNRHKSQQLAGRSFATTADAATALVALGAAEAIVTDGAAPATAATPDGSVTLTPPAVAIRSVTGAGDCFVATHLSARADGLAPGPALAAALAAAARHITRDPA